MLRLLVAAVLFALAAGEPSVVVGDEPACTDDASDPQPPPARSRGPPPTHRSPLPDAEARPHGHCPIRHDPSRRPRPGLKKSGTPAVPSPNASSSGTPRPITPPRSTIK